MSLKAEANEQLVVFWGSERVGYLERNLDDLCFRYDQKWLEDGQAISLSLPLAATTYTVAAHNFFGNLLPEGEFRRKIERIYQVSEDNDYSLLRTIGGDCAGALSIVRADAQGVMTEPDQGYYEKLSETSIQRLLETGGMSAYTAAQAARLSLAGAQGKLPIHRDQSGLYLPCEGAPSTYILKFNRYDQEYPALIENEYFMNRLAYHLGLVVVDCELLTYQQRRIFLTKRYDRCLQTSWPERLHQEDFCQALGFSYRQKYQKEQGPTLAAIIQLARRALGLKAVQAIIEWQFFNVIFGNSDGHAKNLSILHQDRSLQLAPFYDLVCTRAYPQLERSLSLYLADKADPDQWLASDLHGFAKECGVTQRYLRHMLENLFAKTPGAIQAALEDLARSAVDETTLQHVLTTTRKLSQRFQKCLLA